jgi:hypothetical protein
MHAGVHGKCLQVLLDVTNKMVREILAKIGHIQFHGDVFNNFRFVT